ncbi:hypothetical protein [Tropicimonas sp. IMCC6043]|uniref:hypothetical protein n=1 Tax=Tropicimonas sp. IMCC6043 TaxID=2510645 RepID=UPI00101B5AC1|nr:hypothetical protein [Tropicimonas sp. IMCC6043]RYH10351.1 hypothetical protein EU800_08660 [Tropicimonas sp. IMCC6043]
MLDPNRHEFSGRLRRIEKIHRRGGGFEAVGTLGQSHYTRMRMRSGRRPLLRSAIILVVSIVLLKGLLLAGLGEAAYAEKLAQLSTGGVIDRVGGYIMALDPFSSIVAKLLAPIFG